LCDRAVLVAGLWTRDLAAGCGASVPLYPAKHVHVRSNPVPGVDPLMPVVRDLDASLYLRHLNGCVLVGAFEPKGKPIDPRSLPADFAFGEFRADWDHFAPIRGMAEQRMPVLRDVGFDRFLNAPESFTPDANFCLGETAEVAGLFVAAGFNSQGIIFAPGAGRALAEWIVTGAPGFDARSVDVQRFDRQQSNRRYLHDRTREGLGRLYAMHWPHLQPYTARAVRRSPLHDRLSAVGACFGEINGFETANWYAPVGVEPRYEYSYGRQNWFDHAGNEHRAALNTVALADLSGTAKIELAGPDALAVLQYATTRDCDIGVGRSVRTLFLNGAGGVELEAQVLRLEPSRFLLLAPTETHTKIRGVLARDVVGRSASVSDLSTAYAHLALFGPGASALLERVTSGEVGAAPLAPGEVRELEVGRGWAWCVSAGTAGSAAVELLPPTDTAVDVYDHLVDAGRDLGLVHAGLHAVESLRVEAGLRRAGLDTGPASNPLMAGLGHLVDVDKAQDFRGKDRLDAATAAPGARQPASIRLLDPAQLLRGGEVVVRDGVVVGQVTSAAYGHGIGAACGLALIDRNLATGADYSVDTADGLVAARVVDVDVR
jgi:glycine cleavage system aminomethyltransferase T